MYIWNISHIVVYIFIRCNCPVKEMMVKVSVKITVSVKEIMVKVSIKNFRFSYSLSILEL